MNLCRLLPRHWLACHALVWLALTGAVKAEERVVERRLLAGGAEVVVVQVGSRTGGNCHVSLRYRRPDGSEREFYQVDSWLYEKVQCRGNRISFFYFRWYDSFILTLDMNPEGARLYVDQFPSTYGVDFDINVKLLTADEVVLIDKGRERHLLRNESGRLTLHELPYRKNVWSSVVVFSPEYQQINSYRLAYHKGFTVVVGAPAGISVMPGVSTRLQDMHAALSHFIRREPVVSATVAGGPELLLPRLDEMAFSRSSDSYGMTGTGWDTRYLCYDYWPWLRFFDSGKFCPTLGELGLPCYESYYDYIVAEMRDTYAFKYDYWTELLAQSVPSSDELALSELFLHELKMAGL